MDRRITMIGIAVCDDNKVMLQYLKIQISNSFNQKLVKHNINEFLRGTDFIEQHKKTPYDVVFLDIKMPDMNGFEVAKSIRRISKKTYIIFITTEESLVYDSFDFQPFYFIPKGNTKQLEACIHSVINKLITYMAAIEPIQLELPYNDKKYVLPSKIVLVKSYKNYLDVICEEQDTIRVRGNMEYAVQILPSLMFSRIHNRYIVNMKHIAKVDYPNCVIYVDNGEEIEMSRAYKKTFEQEYNLFLRNFV